MKIDRYQPIRPYTHYPLSRPADQPVGSSEKNDKVEISSEAKRMQGLQKLEEERTEKVKQIQAQVEAGTYHVASKDIAQKMYAYWNKR